MSKKKLYGLLAFALFSFAFLGILMNREFSQRSKSINQQNKTEAVMNTSDYVVNTSDDASLADNKNTVDADNSLSQVDDESFSQEENNSLSEEENNSSSVHNQTSSIDLVKNTEDSTLPTDDTVMIFSGDIYLSDYILNKYSNDGIDGILSMKLQDEFANADIAMVNQEFSFSNRGTPAKDKQYTFRIDPKWVKIFQDLKLDIVTLANNHSLDYGTEALLDTFDTLNTSNIKYVGAGKDSSEAKNIIYYTVNNKNIAVLGASRVIPVPDWNAGSSRPGLLTTYDPAILIQEIKIAKEQSDFVVVYVHWGIEKKSSPEEYQRNLAKQYIDAGADLVVGSHPHVLQGIEYYKNKPIVYSLGNFMFYNSINQTAVLKVIIKKNNESEIQLLPCKAEDALTHELEDQTERSQFYQYLKDISFDIDFDTNGTILH